MLREITLSQKEQIVSDSTLCEVSRLKFTETNSKMAATRSWGLSEKRHGLMGLELQICKMKSSKDIFFTK